jgi:zinc transport system substrate-binding protein
MRNFRPLLVCLCLACLPAGPRAAELPLHVFVSIPPQKFFVERIGGDRVRVDVMLEPGHAPETYEPPPRKIAAMQAARLFVLMDVPFERIWLDALPPPGPGFAVVDAGPPGEEPAEHRDPHAWVAPEDARRIARVVRDALIEADPAGAGSYQAGHDALFLELEALDREVRALLDRPRTPYFIISHASLGRFAAAYGLRQVALEEGGREIGTRRLAEITRLARDEGIRTVLVQGQYHAGMARTLARELDATTVDIDPLAEDYIAGMRAIAAAVARATH